MHGVVKKINKKNAVAVVLTERGVYAPFQVVDGHSLKVGDKLEADFESLGSRYFQNLTQKKKFEAFVKDIYSGTELAEKTRDSSSRFRF